MEIRYKKLIPEAKTPYKKIDVDAGFDLYATSIEKTKDYILYHTGIAFEIPEGYVGLIFPRSSVTNQDLILKNCVGVIDASYRGEIMCRFAPIVNDNIVDIKVFSFVRVGEEDDNNKFTYKFIWNEEKQYNVGDRICQIVFLELPKITLIESDELSNTERGSKGFGHSGK